MIHAIKEASLCDKGRNRLEHLQIIAEIVADVFDASDIAIVIEFKLIGRVSGFCKNRPTFSVDTKNSELFMLIQ